MSEAKVSPVETLKLESGYLRGTLAQELQDGNDGFSKGAVQLLKHHGSYQQDNRDDRAAARPGPVCTLGGDGPGVGARPVAASRSRRPSSCCSSRRPR